MCYLSVVNSSRQFLRHTTESLKITKYAMLENDVHCSTDGMVAGSLCRMSQLVFIYIYDLFSNQKINLKHSA